jgi:hypothetical protein
MMMPCGTAYTIPTANKARLVYRFRFGSARLANPTSKAYRCPVSRKYWL